MKYLVFNFEKNKKMFPFVFSVYVKITETLNTRLNKVQKETKYQDKF
jgi:hypothetical protein